ncbi:MAG: XRE family transcriptional regulator [Cardiobacteriaceae bacterium]|nr:XRE family transcriptional regulator [Cardiobacteriaceae bacterium]
MKIETHTSHITPPGGNVFADLGFAEEEAARLKAASEAVIQAKLTLMHCVGDWIADNGLKQADAAQILGISRPRVSDVVNMKTGKFTLDALVMMLAKTGKSIELHVQ